MAPAAGDIRLGSLPFAQALSPVRPIKPIDTNAQPIC
jgi:hypothetical protein